MLRKVIKLFPCLYSFGNGCMCPVCAEKFKQHLKAK